jgi:hypothetical protein
MRKVIVALFLILPVTTWAKSVSLPLMDHMESLSNFSLAFGSPDIVPDSSSPDGGTVMRWTYPDGWDDGYAPGIATITFPPANELYIQYYFKYSSNWSSHPVVDKQMFVWGGDDNFFTGHGFFGSGFTIDFQGKGGSGAIQDSGGVDIQLNRWYRVTIYVKVNTGSNSDGKTQVWLDGVPIITRNSVRFWDGGALMDAVAFTPVWGGYEGRKVPSTQYLYLDGLQVQTTAEGLQVQNAPTGGAGQKPSPPTRLKLD